MRKHVLILVVSVVLLLACNKEKEADSLSCNLETVPSQFDEDSLEVTYKLEADGEYTLTLFYYYDESGRVEIDNPSLPQEIKVSLSEQKTIMTGARGSVKNGHIEVSYEANTSSSSYSGSDRCQQSSQ